MMRRLPVLFMLAVGCDSPFGLAVTDDEVADALECAELLNSWCLDEDGDGYGAKTGAHPPYDACIEYGDDLQPGTTPRSICFPQEDSASACEPENYYVNNCSDCDDRRSEVNVRADECATPADKQDNDCDGLIDEDQDVVIWYLDSDGDGYGDPAPETSISVSSCDEDPADRVAETADMKMDCDDTNPKIHPGADELRCGDGINHNCDDYVSDCALFQIVDVSAASLNGVAFVGATTAVAWHGTGTDDSAYFAVGYPGSERVEIYRGGVDGPELLSTLTGDAGSGFGSALTAGFFDDDDLLDLAVGAPNQVTKDADGVGRVVVYDIQAWSEISTLSQSTAGSFNLGAGMSVIGVSGNDRLGISFSYKDAFGAVEEYVWIRKNVESSTDSLNTSVDLLLDGLKTTDEWPLALASATFGGDTLVGVGASNGVSGADPGLAVYILLDPLPELKLTDMAGSTSALGASLAFGTLTNGKSLVIVGAPGTGAVYMLEDTLSGEFNVHLNNSSTRAPYWEAAGAGSSLSLIGDIDLDGDEELAVGGDDTLWIIAQDASGFLGGDLNDGTVAPGKITGFGGTLRHIVNAGDVNGDTYADLLVSTDTTTTLLYGGYVPQKAQDGASDTGDE